ncbi:hypothetical protein [Motilimonas sp. KMU-193]|uniref:hypothetical protein n=1 Tax=Motilimonas sp. KMU-193 TaxID=3388668 RepID=UPI00396B029C
MFKNVIICTLLMILVACSKHQPEITAVEFVEKMKLGDNLFSLSFKVSKNTQTFRLLAKNLGENEASTRLEKELFKKVKIHQGKWNDNLANSYLEYFSVAELNSIFYEKRNSKYAEKMTKMQKRVGDSMENRSKELLKLVVTESLNSVNKSVQ